MGWSAPVLGLSKSMVAFCGLPQDEEQTIMQVATLGIDIGKTWFHVVGLDLTGKPVVREKLNRQKLMRFMGTCPRCLVGMEACGGSQHLARRFLELGHDVKLIAPRFVKAYLKSNKNDFNDAAAIAEAVQRPTMRFVALRSIEQVDLQAIHRVRDQLISERTAFVSRVAGSASNAVNRGETPVGFPGLRRCCRRARSRFCAKQSLASSNETRSRDRATCLRNKGSTPQFMTAGDSTVESRFSTTIWPNSLRSTGGGEFLRRMCWWNHRCHPSYWATTL